MKSTKVKMGKVFGLMTVITSQLFVAACSNSSLQSLSLPSSDSSIVNGKTATSTDVQSRGFANPVVAIFSMLDESSGEGALCTGTLISPTIVLTAGHCLADAKANTKIFITFQTLNLKDSNVLNTVLARNFVIHPNFINAIANNTNNSADDIALILLNTPAPSDVTPASLAPVNVNLASLNKLTSIGYGQADDRHNAKDAQSGTLRYLEYTSKQVANYTASGFLNGMIVAVNPNASICHGDSGGPLFAGGADGSQKIIVGINDMVFPLYSGQQEIDYKAAAKAGNIKSFYGKYPDAHICLGFNAFVNVSTHLDWINQTKNKLESIAEVSAKK